MATTETMSKLSPVLYGRMKANGITSKDIVRMTEASPNTVRKCLRDPESATLSTLLRISDYIGITRSELCHYIQRL